MLLGLFKLVVLSLMLIISMNPVQAWPRLKTTEVTVCPSTGLKAEPIGPPCTVDAHNKAQGDCPNMKQPDPPENSTAGTLHVWPNDFIVDWSMTFDPNMDDTPPWGSKNPSTEVNVTRGTTYYSYDADTGVRSMREDYKTHCIPVFEPFDSNDFGCSFINAYANTDNGTSYVVFDAPQYPDVPECCIIGQPFHPPPPNFAENMPLLYRDTAAGGVLVDWNVVWDKDAGPFAYGFNAKTEQPEQFYMTGILADQPLWMVQRFVHFQTTVPPLSTWDIPSSCDTALACPGW